MLIRITCIQKQEYVGTLYDIHETSGNLKVEPAEKFMDSEGYLKIFDKQSQKWQRAHINEIPVTYSYVPKPTNYRMEAQLWLETGHILRHKLIWSRPNIPKDAFEKMSSTINVLNYDRYAYIDINNGKRLKIKFNHV